MKLSDVPVGEIAVYRETLGDAQSGREIREVYYRREDGDPCRHPHNVRVARIGIIQGDDNDTPAGGRYIRAFDPPIRDPGEADGRIEVSVGATSAVWWVTLNRALTEAARGRVGT